MEEVISKMENTFDYVIILLKKLKIRFVDTAHNNNINFA